MTAATAAATAAAATATTPTAQPLLQHPSSPNTNPNPGNTSTTSTLHSTSNKKVACLHCRDKKLKCDKIWPICSRCKLKGVECLYKEHRKTGPKPNSERSRKGKEKDTTKENKNDNDTEIDTNNKNKEKKQSVATKARKSSKSNAAKVVELKRDSSNDSNEISDNASPSPPTPPATTKRQKVEHQNQLQYQHPVSSFPSDTPTPRIPIHNFLNHAAPPMSNNNSLSHSHSQNGSNSPSIHLSHFNYNYNSNGNHYGHRMYSGASPVPLIPPNGFTPSPSFLYQHISPSIPASIPSPLHHTLTPSQQQQALFNTASPIQSTTYPSLTDSGSNNNGSIHAHAHAHDNPHKKQSSPSSSAPDSYDTSLTSITNKSFEEVIGLPKLSLTMADIDKFHAFYFNSNTRIFKYSVPRYYNRFIKEPRSILHYSYMIWTVAAFYLDEYSHIVDKLYETSLKQMNDYWESNRDSFHSDILTYLHALCLKAQFEFLSGREMRAALTISSSIRLTQMYGYDQIDLSPTTLGTPAIFFRSFSLSSTPFEPTNMLLRDDDLDPDIPLVEERRRVLWEVYAIDKWSSLVTGLPCALSVDSLSVIFTKLPSPTTFLPLNSDNGNEEHNADTDGAETTSAAAGSGTSSGSGSGSGSGPGHTHDHGSGHDPNSDSLADGEQSSYYLHEAMQKLDNNQVLLDINSSSSKILLLTISENIIKWCKMFLNMVELETLKNPATIDSIRHKVDELVKNFESMHNNLLFFDLTTEPLMNIVITNTSILLYQSVLIKFSSLFDVQYREDPTGGKICKNEIELFRDILMEVSTISEKLILRFIKKARINNHLKKAPVFIVFINSIKSVFQCIAFIYRFNKILKFDDARTASLLATINSLSAILNSMPGKIPIVEKTKAIINNGQEMLDHSPHLLSFFDSFFDSATTY